MCRYAQCLILRQPAARYIPVLYSWIQAWLRFLQPCSCCNSTCTVLVIMLIPSWLCCCEFILNWILVATYAIMYRYAQCVLLRQPAAGDIPVLYCWIQSLLRFRQPCACCNSTCKVLVIILIPSWLYCCEFILNWISLTTYAIVFRYAQCMILRQPAAGYIPVLYCWIQAWLRFLQPCACCNSMCTVLVIKLIPS